MSVSMIKIEETVRAALMEDLGHGYDLTTQYVIDGAKDCTAAITAREDGVLAGIAPALTAFSLTDQDIEFQIEKVDGEVFQANEVIARLRGPAQAILTAERVALNFLCHLSGVASLTHQFVSHVDHTDSKILCTRKTLPHLRALQKDAVRSGGGCNHRLGLDNGILIKDNHIALSGGIQEALEQAKAKAGPMQKIEIEVSTPEQAQQALSSGLADIIMLDNMEVAQIRKCMDIIDDSVCVEASGGINLDNLVQIAEAGVHYISIGILTHSARSVDIGLDIEEQ